jgi:hypothetical protein
LRNAAISPRGVHRMCGRKPMIGAGPWILDRLLGKMTACPSLDGGISFLSR